MALAGHIFQEEKGDGTPEGEDSRETEGRRSTEDAWGDWTWGKALKLGQNEGECIKMYENGQYHMGRR